jgi:integrase
MKPNDNPPLFATIRPPSDRKSHEAFAQWASENGCFEIADHLLCTLNAYTASKWLLDIVHFLTAANQDLVRWETHGHDTHGLAHLSTLLIGKEANATLGSRRAASNSAITDYPPRASETHYLQLALVCRSHKEPTPSILDRYQNFRLWLLLEAMQRSVDGVVLDANLKTVAKVIRQAGEDRHRQDWYPFLMSILGAHPTPTGIKIHIMNEGSSLMADKDKFPPGTAKYQFLEAMVAVARGHVSDYTRNEHHQPRRPYLCRADARDPSHQHQHPSDEPSPQEFDDPEDAKQTPSHLEQNPVTSAEVDPNLNRQEQELATKYVTLTNAAKARVVAWDWECINPIEEHQLRAQLTNAYRSTNAKYRLIAAISEICVMGGRSMNIALRIKVGVNPPVSKEWSFDVAIGQLKRKPPRRKSHANPTEKWGHLVPAEAEAICITVSPDCVAVIKDAFEAASPASPVRTLRQLWPYADKEPTALFVEWLRNDPALWRITPGMLGSVAQRTELAENGDWLKARLLFSQSDEGLPAAASYAAYSQPETHSKNISTTPANQNLNAAGGRIDAAEDFYAAGIEKLYKRVQAVAKSTDYIEFSNCVAIYWDALLRSATGSRPGTDLWQWLHIDWEEAFAFIDDKTGIDQSAARWAPIPSKLLTELDTSFRQRHVPKVCSLLLQEFGETGSLEARTALNTGLCWLNREGSKVHAEPIGAKQRAMLGEHAAEHPLVTNAFRHRSRNVWRRNRLDQEVTDGFMSHGDGATRTHGDFSPRIWKQDVDLARPILSASFESLTAKLPPDYEHPDPILNALPPAPPTSSTKEVAGTDRASARWRVFLKAAREAFHEISLHVIQADMSFLGKFNPHVGRLSHADMQAGVSKFSVDQTRRLATSLTRTKKDTPATLSSRFESLFYAVDLRALDEDELTKVLHELLEVDQTENPEFILARLREFLKFCERNHGLATPYWEELQVEDKTIGVAPGYISASIYRKLLVHILYRSGLDHGDALRAALYAMLSYRFGLRKAESAGMRWKDWINIEDMICVVVTCLNHRDLKRNNSSRRVVPLLWRLTSFEKQLIQDHAVLMKEHAKTNPETLFFAHPNDPTRDVDANDLASIVTDALKLLGGRHLTHHHLRHTFAANVWRALELPLESSSSSVDRDKRIRVRELLLQSQNVGRRAPWALARILGHSHPAQGYRSYVHDLCDYADDLTFKEPPLGRNVDTWSRLVDLDQFPLVDHKVAPIATQKHSTPPTMREVILAIRLIGNGVKPASAARSLQTKVAWIEKAQVALADLDTRLFAEAQPEIDKEVNSKKSNSKRGTVATRTSLITSTPPSKFIFKKAGSSKLMTHILSSKLDALTTLLETSSQQWDDATTPRSIQTGDFTAAFGQRLQVSLWTTDQMSFFKWAIDSLDLKRARLTLVAPAKLDALVKTSAQKTGWLADPDAHVNENSQESKSQIFPLTVETGRQEVVHYQVPTVGRVRVESRLSLLLATDERQVIGNKFEFIFCLYVCWVWTASRNHS